jgi:hypothetical protein
MKFVEDHLQRMLHEMGGRLLRRVRAGKPFRHTPECLKHFNELHAPRDTIADSINPPSVPRLCLLYTLESGLLWMCMVMTTRSRLQIAVGSLRNVPETPASWLFIPIWKVLARAASCLTLVTWDTVDWLTNAGF